MLLPVLINNTTTTNTQTVKNDDGKPTIAYNKLKADYLRSTDDKQLNADQPLSTHHSL